jgi:hypothetical protein
MILAFADDRTVTAFDNAYEANGYCEGPDVEAGVYTFLDEHGMVLKPEQEIPQPTWAGHFKLVPTEERRLDLLQAVFKREITVERGPRIATQEQLIKELQLS